MGLQCFIAEPMVNVMFLWMIFRKAGFLRAAISLCLLPLAESLMSAIFRKGFEIVGHVGFRAPMAVSFVSGVAPLGVLALKAWPSARLSDA